MMNPQIRHVLTDGATGKVSVLVLDGCKLVVESGLPGKTRSTQKVHASPTAAATQFEKKEWELLKKGYVMREPDAAVGNPCLHRYVGGGYTGCLTLVAVGEQMAVYRHGVFEPAQSEDYLISINRAGTMLESITLPKPLPGSACFYANTTTLLLDVDHFIYTYDLAKKRFRELIGTFEKPASFIALSGTIAAYASHPALEVRDLQSDEILYRARVNCEQYGGHSDQLAGALSARGDQLALCTKPGEIVLMTMPTGKQIGMIRGDFAMVAQLAFVGGTLLVREQYGTWSLRFFDLKTLAQIKSPIDIEGVVTHACLNADQSRLAVILGKRVTVFDLATGQPRCGFTSAHCVKTCQAAFWGQQLGVRTDYGCFSVYNV